MLSPEDETRAVAGVTERLAASFPDLAPELIQGAVDASHRQFTGSKIRDFVPVLVERLAKTTLTSSVTTL